MPSWIRYEAQLWAAAVVSRVPGLIGCRLRNLVMPYKHGRDVRVWDGVHIDWPSRLVLGDRVSINRGCILNAGGGITIEDDVLIGPRVIIYSQNHTTSGGDPINQQGYEFSPVRIGAGAWIAAGVVILPGVEIGRGSVVGAGTLVAKSVPPNVVAVGNPARVIRQIRMNVEDHAR